MNKLVRMVGAYGERIRRDDGGSEFGVDLNRNFGYKWGYDNDGSNPDSTRDNYRGAKPFSEPETKAVRDFCIKHNFLICINYHTYSNLIVPPWEYNLKPSQDSLIFNSLISLANPLNGYHNGIWYTSNGTADDWMYGETSLKNKIYSVTPEVGSSFWPTPEEIIPLAEENLYSNLVYAWGPGIIENPPFISDAYLNKIFFHPFLDSVKITAIEKNPDNHTSEVFAKIFGEDDSLIK